jgi:hypothetical protein
VGVVSMVASFMASVSSSSSLSGAGDSSVSMTRVVMDSLLDFWPRFWHLSLQSQLRHLRCSWKQAHRLVWHVDILVQLQHLLSWTGVDCRGLIFITVSFKDPLLGLFGSGFAGEMPWSLLLGAPSSLPVLPGSAYGSLLRGLLG